MWSSEALRSSDGGMKCPHQTPPLLLNLLPLITHAGGKYCRGDFGTPDIKNQKSS